jgi:hypothetical protein
MHLQVSTEDEGSDPSSPRGDHSPNLALGNETAPVFPYSERDDIQTSMDESGTSDEEIWSTNSALDKPISVVPAHSPLDSDGSEEKSGTLPAFSNLLTTPKSTHRSTPTSPRSQRFPQSSGGNSSISTLHAGDSPTLSLSAYLSPSSPRRFLELPQALSSIRNQRRTSLPGSTGCSYCGGDHATSSCTASYYYSPTSRRCSVHSLPAGLKSPVSF